MPSQSREPRRGCSLLTCNLPALALLSVVGAGGTGMTGVDELPAVGTAEPLSDMDVVRRVRAGETALFEILMRRHNQRIYRVARAIVKDDSEAEDVMQEAYVNAYTHLHQF